jgi:hypothetical protein
MKLFIFLNTFTISGLLILNNLCAQEIALTPKQSKFSIQVISEVREYEKIDLPKLRVKYQLPYENNLIKKSTVVVELMNGKVRKLSYQSYEEGYKSSAPQIYYFDIAGRLICHINRSTGELSYDIFCDSSVLIFYQEDDPRNMMLGREAIPFVLAQTKYWIDYYLCQINSSMYRTFNLSNNNSFYLRTEKDLELRNQPTKNSSVLRLLRKGEKLYYIDRSASIDTTFNSARWTWYKVRLLSGKDGWVFGNPAMVNEPQSE